MENLDEDCEKFGEDNLSICINNEQRTYVNKAVSSLKDKYRIPILLFYKEEMSVGEISEVMGIPEGTVKSRLSYARGLLRKQPILSRTRDMMETRSILQSRWCILLQIIFSISYLLKGLMTEQRWLRR